MAAESVVLAGVAYALDLTPELEVDGQWLDVDACAGRGIELTATREDLADPERVALRLRLENKGAAFACGGFRWRRDGARADFLGADGRDLRVYLEGWTMPSACGSKRYGDRDFACDPGYVRFSVCRPDLLDSKTPNRFRAEHLIVVDNQKTGGNLLVGFVTSDRQFGRFELTLGEGGCERFAAVSDCDGVRVDTGDALESETLCFMARAGTAQTADDDGYALLENFADLWGETMGARRFPKLPVGWCSWYYYFSKVTEADMLENVRFLRERREEYPLEYIQLDDGYQSACGDWLDWNEKFPGGPRFLAEEIRKAGFKPALWLAPFLVEDGSRLLAAHPDWMVKNDEGEVDYPYSWRGNRTAILDGSHPGAQDYLEGLFRAVRGAGYEYIKLDFLGMGTVTGRRHDPKATRCQALRRGMEAARRGFGEDGFILGCTAPLGSLIGVVDGMRIATDITPYWAPDREYFDEAPTVPNVCRNGINRSYMHRRLWLSDPDTHIARKSDNRLTEDEVMLWTGVLRMLGGMLLLSDRFETLEPERAALSRWLLSSPDEYSARPVDFFERHLPSIWLSTSRRDGGRLLGLFNFEDAPREFTVRASRFGMEKLRLTDDYTGREVFAGGVEWSETLAPHSCRVYKVS